MSLTGDKMISQCEIGFAEYTENNTGLDNMDCHYNRRTIEKTMKQCGIISKTPQN